MVGIGIAGIAFEPLREPIPILEFGIVGPDEPVQRLFVYGYSFAGLGHRHLMTIRTESSHLFLIDPLPDFGQQAIGLPQIAFDGAGAQAHFRRDFPL